MPGEMGGRYKVLLVLPGASWVSRAVEQDPVRPLLAVDIRNPSGEWAQPPQPVSST